MIKLENNNQQDKINQLNKTENILEPNKFTAENNPENIMDEVEQKSEALINESYEDLNRNFESFAKVAGNDLEPLSELEVIKFRTEAGILNQQNIFKTELQAISPKINNEVRISDNHAHENKNNKPNSSEVLLNAIKIAYSQIRVYEKALKNSHEEDAGSQESLKIMLIESRSVLEDSIISYKALLSDKVKESFKNNHEMTPLKALDEIIIPGLSSIEKEKAAALHPIELRIFKKGLEVINFYMPQGKIAKTLTVAGIMTIASLALSSAPSVGLAVYLGCKLGRSLIGSYVGEKVSEAVEKHIDKGAEKKKEKAIEKINFSPDDINNSINKLIELGDVNLKSQKNKTLLKNFSKISTHIAVAGITVAGLEFAQLGVNGLLSGGVEASSHKAAEQSFKTLAAETLYVCSHNAGLELTQDKVIDKASANSLHKRLKDNHAKIMMDREAVTE